jgi:VCBS repeat-containing protein
MQGNNIQEEVNRILESMDNQNEQDDQKPTPPSPPESTEPIEDIYVFIVREKEAEPDLPEDTEVIETTLVQQKPSLLLIAVCFFALLLPISSIAFQLYLAFNPFIATVTILPKSQQVTLSGTLQLGRMLPQITLSGSQTAPTTGKGHQDARNATGFITFYNGQFQAITVAAGTIFTGRDGTRIVTDQAVIIPAASLNPPVFGQVSISAHAARPGASGNIQAYDINQTCCATSILVKNTSSFYGGQDARDFQTVSQADIHIISTLLKTKLTKQGTIALQKQMKTGEVMIAPICTPTIQSDHQPGEEANQVTVTVSETCKAAAYNTHELQTDATTLVTSQALKTLGSSYSLTSHVQVTIKQATITGTHINLVFSSQGTYSYRLSTKAQERIKKLIAGKTTQEALQILAALPGIQSASIHFDDNIKLPKDPKNIHIVQVM